MDPNAFIDIKIEGEETEALPLVRNEQKENGGFNGNAFEEDTSEANTEPFGFDFTKEKESLRSGTPDSVSLLDVEEEDATVS